MEGGAGVRLTLIRHYSNITYMIRTQVYLTSLQHRRLKEEAAREGLSMTEALRRIIDAHLNERQGLKGLSKESVMSLIGLGCSGHAGTSEQHDQAQRFLALERIMGAEYRTLSHMSMG